ncbi:MAG: hypothetical protein K2O32_14155, partial [Acetatifactor sp.]|nr:hypothetical protein [Acetatifactor sp.]
ASDGGSTGETKFIDIAITETKPVSGGGGETPKDPDDDKTGVKATVTVKDANHLLKTGDTIKLVNSANKSDAVDITSSDGDDVDLKANSTYDIVSSNKDIKATTDDGKTTVKTTTEALTVTVNLTAAESSGGDLYTYTTIYDFMNGSIIPKTNTEIEDSMTSEDKKLTYKKGGSTQCQYNSAQHGVEFKADNQIIIHVLGKAKVFIGGCQYSAGALTITSGETELKSWSAAEVKGTGCYDKDPEKNGLFYEYDGEETDLVLNIKDSKVYIPIITVERTEPKPEKTEVKATVTVKDDDHLLQTGDTIKLVNAADEKDYHDITAYTSSDGEDIELKVNSVYEIVSSNPDIKATAGGLDKVTTTTEDLTVNVTLEATVVNPTITVSKAAGVPADAEYTLTLVNDANATDTCTLTDGGTVKLKIGATYKLECSNKDIVATINGSTILAVNDKLSSITVSLDVPDTTHHTYDVWDFGAEALTNTDLITYNNLLTVNNINTWFKGDDDTFEADGKDIDAGGGLTIVSNGNKKKWRLRTRNSALKGETESELKDELGNFYQGILYDNAGKGAMWLTLDVKAGDKVTAVVGSNANEDISYITWESPSGEDVQTYEFTRKSRTKLANTCTFTASEDGAYKLYTPNEKLVVARIYRERPNTVTVSGTVTLPSGTTWSNDAKLVFTNQTTGQQTEATVTNTNNTLTYTVSLFEQYGYDVSLENLEGVIVGAKNTLNLPNEAGDTTFNVECIAVDLVVVTGSLADLTPAAAKKLTLTFKNDEKIYVPKITIDAENVTYTGKFEKDVEYTIKESGVNDYTLETTTIKASAAGTKDIIFKAKPVYAINVKLEGPTAEEAANVALTFSLLDENFEPDGYEYSFTGTQNTKLRDGQYKVKAELEGYTQKVTSDVKVKGEAVDKTIVMIANTPAQPVPYKETITVGATGEYRTINDALDAVRRMTRTDDQRVTISIAPGDYEEMLVVDVPNVTLKNASATPSIALKNKGVDIDENAVRVTWYYGHGYTYYSMGSDCKYDEELLAVNKENGYASFKNPGSGTTNGSYWNATVVINADGFQAEGIIFENSFNQYMSKKAAADVIVKQSSAKEGSVARSKMEAGNTKVQEKAYVERAAALAIYNNKKEISFDNCKFVGRQDTLYGGTDVTAAFYGCSIYGGTDYIFGGMTAVFAKCDLVFNTMETNTDVGYITAAQQKSGRGYLMYNCNVTSTTPGVDTASTEVSKPGYFGRPWQKDTSEVVFYYTIIGTANDGTSLIAPIGWNDSLSGTSNNVYEYKTYEKTANTDNSAKRAKWSQVLTEDPILDDNSTICVETFFGKWAPFKGKDMTIKLPDDTTIEEPVENTSFDGWDKVAKPVIDETSYVSGDGSDKLIVKVTANVGDEGGQRVRVTVKKTNDESAAPQSQSSTKKQDKHQFEFSIPGSGTYEITVALERKGQQDKVTTKRITINDKGQLTAKEGLYVELLDDGEYTYTGSAIKPKIAVYNGDELLKEGTDYTVKYSNNVKAAKRDSGNKAPTITITGKGKFTGQTKQTFTIQPKDLTDDDVFIGGLSKEAANTLVVAADVKLSPILVYKGVVLKVGPKKDFTLSKDRVTKSDTEITIEGVNNYTGKLTLSLDVKAKNELKKITTVKVDKNKVKNYAYDGTEKEIPIEEVKAGSQKLEKDDYIVVPNGDLTSAGTQKFTVIGVGIYAGSKTTSFKINPRKVTIPDSDVKVDDSLKVDGVVTCEFNSAGVTFSDAITVTDAGLQDTELELGKDYKVTYSGNKKVGTGKYTVTFLGNYKGSKTVTKSYNFKITAADLAAMAQTNDPSDKEGLYLKSADKAYGKNAAIIKSAPYVLVNGVALKTSDYTVKYYLDEDKQTEMKGKDKVELGATDISKTVYVEITGKKNYTGTVMTSFNVVKGTTDISRAKITFKDNGSPAKKQSKVEYTGEAVYPYSMEIKVGTTAVTTLKYDAATGSWVDSNGTATSNFDIVVVNNIAKGKATVIVTGDGDNYGSKTATFNVVAYNLKNVTVASFWDDILKLPFGRLGL